MKTLSIVKAGKIKKQDFRVGILAIQLLCTVKKEALFTLEPKTVSVKVIVQGVISEVTSKGEMVRGQLCKGQQLKGGQWRSDL